MDICHNTVADLTSKYGSGFFMCPAFAPMACSSIILEYITLRLQIPMVRERTFNYHVVQEYASKLYPRKGPKSTVPITNDINR